MFSVPTFDLLTDAGKQQFIEYVVNLSRKEINSYTPSFNNVTSTITDNLTNVVYQNTPYLDFNTEFPGTIGIGQIAWNDTAGTLEFGLKGGNVTMPIGTRSVAMVKHADNTGLAKGKVVYVVGSDGANKNVRYALATSDVTSARTFGVVAETVSGGAKGFITTQGLLENLNTIGLTEGAPIWVSPTTAGELTTTKPVAPDHLVLVGWCIRSHATTGVIFVHVVNGFELDELHDVKITSPADNQTLTYDAAQSLWINKTGGGGGVPIGSIIWFSQGVMPVGFLVANGSSQLRSAYPDLFAAIGTTYGQGSVPGTTFALPSVVSTTGTYGVCTQVTSVLNTTNSLIAVPIGTLQLYAGSVYPTGWLRADGSAISRTTYAGLFAIIGTVYGSGDGSTTFNLPNLTSSGAGSPVYIIKVVLSGDVEPSTVAHAFRHIRGGSDVVDGDRVQVDWVPTRYTRDSSATEAGATTDLTAHLKGIDNWMYYGMPVFTTEAARNAAIPSPSEGMRAYITAPTIPTTTGGGSAIPSGITTIYNGTTWVCVTPVGVWNTSPCTAQSISAYGTCLWSGNALTVTANTGAMALVTLTARIYASGTQYFFAAVKPGSGTATDGFSISTQTSTGANTHSIGGSWLFTGLPSATNTFTVQMRNNGGVSMAIDQCHLTVTGVA